MPENQTEDLAGTVQQLIELSGQLLEALDRERAALVSRCLDELGTAAEDKARLCAVIDEVTRALGDEPLGVQIDRLPAPHRDALRAAHAELVELATRTRDCNAVNGKVLRRSQQSVRELMQVMSGTDTGTLYSEQGYSEQGLSAPGTPGTAIARA